MIKAIIFDNNGVLAYSDAERTIPAFAKYFGVTEEYLESFFHDVAKPYDDGQINTQDFYKELSSIIRKPYNYEDLRRSQIQSYAPRPGMQELVRTLGQKYMMALLTNLGDIFDEANSEQWHYETLFAPENIFVSYKLKMKKPDKAIYEYVLDKLDVRPNEAVFVDDRESNLIPARELGLNTVLFTGVEQFKADIEKVLGQND